MTALSGQVAALFTNSGTSTPVLGAATTPVSGTTTEFYITDRTHSWWDAAYPVSVYDGITLVTPEEVYYAAGVVKLFAAPIGAVTITANWFVPQALGGVYGFEATMKADTVDITSFPLELNNPVIWKSYLKTLLDWTGKASRHFFTGHAYAMVNCTNPNSDITWTLREWGDGGNAEQIQYVTGAALAIVFAAHKFTVTLNTGVTTANDIKAYVDASPTLSPLVELEVDGTGLGIVNVTSTQNFIGGHDEGTDFAWSENPVLLRYYINTTTGALQMLSGRAIVVGLPMNVKLDSVQEADLSFQGLGPLKYHTV